MSIWTRLMNVLRADRVSSEIEEEHASHLQEAMEAGQSPDDARRAFGPALQLREASRDLRLVPWLDAMYADVVFGWRQIKKNKVSSAASILSLALAIGACGAAFRLIDAMLLRPLPIADADRLYLLAARGVGPAGNVRTSESSEYPLFERMRAAVKGEAEMIAASYGDRVDVTYGSDDQMEKAQWQFVSGWMFETFGIRPAAGRLFTELDDTTPNAHPYAVLSYDYWTRRFGRDSNAIGRGVRIGDTVFEIVGVASAPFTGTEPGTPVDIFVPCMMNPGVKRVDSSWFRSLVMLKPGVDPARVRAKLASVFHVFREERAKRWTSQTKQFLDRFLNQTVLMLPAAAGVSDMQNSYRSSLLALGVLAAFVLVIASANVANLKAAQAAAMAREMALRMSIGAGRWRLVQMVLVENAWLGMLAALVGGVFSWWATPFLVSHINPPDNPARFWLPMDWRVVAFGLALALAVTLLLGLSPALRASSIRPVSALKGGDDPHSRRRLMHALIAVQVALCLVLNLAAVLLVATFNRLAHQPTGFSAERLLAVEARSAHPQLAPVWSQVAEKLRTAPGVERVAIMGWPLLGGNGWNGFIWVNGAPTEVLSYFLSVSPEWRETMGIPLVDGRDLNQHDISPGSALVNEAFVAQCFGGANPVGKWFEKETGNGVSRDRFQVVGIVRNARYRNMREPLTPTAYVPSYSSAGVPQPNGTGAFRTFLVRTSARDAMSLASTLRAEIPRARPELRVSNVRTQKELIDRQMVRERLLAWLAVFFATVALLLSGVGLFGVLDYCVLQRRREIGIRLALGAPALNIVWRVTGGALAMVALGACVGLALGLASAKYIEAILFGVKATDLNMLAIPAFTILAAAVIAVLPALLRALRIEPSILLRSE